MQNLTKLEVIDIRNTLIESIPLELGTLENLFEVDWRNTPMEKNYADKYNISVNNIVQLKEYLLTSNTRKTLETSMYEYLLREHYVNDADHPHIRSIIHKLVAVIEDD
jgi:hypothetical protein